MSTDTVPDIFEKPGVPYSTTTDDYSTTTIGAALPPVETAAVVNYPVGGGAPSSDPLAITFSGTISTPPDMVQDTLITPITISTNFSGGPPPKVYSIFSGTLPPGLALNASTGVVSGTPTTPQAAANVVFRGTDNAGNNANSNAVPFTVVAGAVEVALAFETIMYTGNGAASRSIASIVNLASGGVVIICNLSAGGAWAFMSADGTTIKGAEMASTGNYAAPPVTFSAAGFQFTAATYNTNAVNYVAWVFKKLRRLLDVVLYTGDGSTSARAISHSLGIAPGRIYAGRVDGVVGGLQVFDRTPGATQSNAANGSNGWSVSAAWANTAPTITTFTVGGGGAIINANAVPYAAFLFAHDTASDGVIQVPSYTGNSSASGPTVTLGWLPQFILNKNGGSTSWNVADTTRTQNFTGNEQRAYVGQTLAADVGWGNAYTLVTNGVQLTAPSADCNGSGSVYNAVMVRNAIAWDAVIMQAGGYALSGNGRIITYDNTGNRNAKSNYSKSGKLYYEAKLNTAGPGGMQTMVGFANATHSATAKIGNDLNSVSADNLCQISYNGVPQGSLYTAFVVNDVWMLAYDTANGHFWVGRNGTWFNSGNPAAGTGYVATGFVGAAAFAVSCVDTAGSPPFAVVTGNFTLAQMAYTVPTGFSVLGT